MAPFNDCFCVQNNEIISFVHCESRSVKWTQKVVLGVKFDSLQFAVCKQTLRSLRQRQTSLLSHICHKIEQRLYRLIYRLLSKFIFQNKTLNRCYKYLKTKKVEYIVSNTALTALCYVLKHSKFWFKFSSKVWKSRTHLHILILCSFRHHQLVSSTNITYMFI